MMSQMLSQTKKPKTVSDKAGLTHFLILSQTVEKSGFCLQGKRIFDALFCGESSWLIFSH